MNFLEEIGSPPPGVAEEAVHDVRTMFEVNTFRPLRVTQALLPLLRKSTTPRVVMMSSGLGSIADTADTASLIWGVDAAGYSASKAALNMLTVKLAKALLPYGVKVNAADPGYTATDLNGHSGPRVFAGIPASLQMIGRPWRIVGIALAAALVGQTALLVYVFEGQPWQTEMHFYFFAVLAMLAGFCDGPVLLIAAALIAIYHVALNALDSAALYPGGEDALRLAVHALVVVIETAMLVIFARLIKQAFGDAASAREHALANAKRLTAFDAERERRLEDAARRNLDLEALLDRFKETVSSSLGRLFDESRLLDDTADAFSQAISKTTSETVAVVASGDSASALVAEVACTGRAYLGTMSVIAGNTSASAQMGQAAVAEAKATQRRLKS